jgi:hypothetical protein
MPDYRLRSRHVERPRSSRVDRSHVRVHSRGVRVIGAATRADKRLVNARCARVIDSRRSAGAGAIDADDRSHR